MTELLERTKGLLELARAATFDHTEQERLTRALRQLHEPLRVALVGRMKSGKSTLLNGIVGDRVAPTGATECTRVVTEYRHGPSYSATAVLHGGRREILRVTRDGRGAVIELDDRRPTDLARIDVEFPSPRLLGAVLVDTPGTTSLDEEVAAAGASVTSLRAADLNVDVLICVMRQLDPHDIDFLEAFRTPGLLALGAVNCIGVLARADDVGGGRVDAMRLAREMAASWQRVPALRRLVAGVIPVAGLLAESASGFSETDYRELRRLAEELSAADAAALTSTDLFVEHRAFDLPASRRIELMGLFGLHGLVAALRWIRLGMAESSTELAERLRSHSGIEDLRRWVFGTLIERRDVLKAQRALDVLEDVSAGLDGDRRRDVARELERVQSNAHELAELRALNRLRSEEELVLTAQQRADLWRALGGDGPSAVARLGTDSDAAQAALAASASWQRVAESPASSPDLRRLARLAARSTSALASPTPSSETVRSERGEPSGSSR